MRNWLLSEEVSGVLQIISIFVLIVSDFFIVAFMY